MDNIKDILMAQEVAAAQQPQEAPRVAPQASLIQRILELLSGQTGMAAERDRLQPPASTTGPRG
jgi:hypothetical protein